MKFGEFLLGSCNQTFVWSDVFSENIFPTVKVKIFFSNIYVPIKIKFAVYRRENRRSHLIIGDSSSR